MSDRAQHLGVETTATFWASRVIGHIRTIKDSPMVMLVSGYIAAMSVGEKYPEGDDELSAMDRIELVVAAEQKAFDEYMGCLENWAAGTNELRKAARLAGMLAEANYLSLTAIEEPDDYIEYAADCAKEYASIVTTAVAMLAKTSSWAEENEPMAGDEEDTEGL